MYRRAWSLIMAMLCVANVGSMIVDLLHLRKYRRRADDYEYEQWLKKFESERYTRRTHNILNEFMDWHRERDICLSNEQYAKLNELLYGWECELREAHR